jgi:hypothetical protein
MKKADNPALTSSLLDQLRQVFHSLVIDETGSGHILRDFETLSKFIGTDGIRVSGKNKLIPLKLLPQLNALMTRPIEVGLRRPLQKSYPHINGLYLLLRAAGFARIDGFGSKQTMRIDEAVLQSWRTLNAFERYFTLFEVWMLRGDPAIIGEHGGTFDTPVTKWAYFFQRIPDKGLKINGNRDEENFITYIPGYYTLALLELFGLITARHAKPEKGKGWRISRVDRTLLGEALLGLVIPYLTSTDYFRSRISGEDKSVPGALQPIMKPFFPEWRKTLVVPQLEFQSGIYVFKVSLGNCWRRIAIPAQMDLDTLSNSILDAFDFDEDHLYEFSYKNRFGMLEQIYHPGMDALPSADEVRIGDLPLRPGNAMGYLYDFGDNWQFDIMLEKIEPAERKCKNPVLLESYGEAPQQYGDWEEWDELDEWDEE